MNVIDQQARHGIAIRVSGVVQGVGFRPGVWRLANELGVTGNVLNDGCGVLIHAWGSSAVLTHFIQRLENAPLPLARIDSIQRSPLVAQPVPHDFQILASTSGDIRSAVAADAATCAQCLAEVRDPGNRRYRYPFTNCTHCGPRLSIVNAIPYDRVNTSMHVFRMCDACQREYDDPANRRFHAQANACPTCGPQLSLVDRNGSVIEHHGDALAAVGELLDRGYIVAIKGIGGFHFACDALNETAVKRLRSRKRRYHKPLALMAGDIATVQNYATLTPTERDLLQDKARPVVLVQTAANALPEAVAPGQRTLGFMLPYSPLHHLLFDDRHQPLVFTSGNSSDEPQCIDNREALRRLANIADYFLLHDRGIVNRLDDSVMRVLDQQPRFLRRARGFAPEPLLLPPGVPQSPAVLAMGAELKNTFCLTQDNEAIVSQHIGDLQELTAMRDYRHQIQRYRQLLDHRPTLIAVDQHPEYLSSKLGKELAREFQLALVTVQHHHAHVAACMAEHGLPLGTKPVLGVAMDGLGFGEDGSIWGGEFLCVDYRTSKRLAALQAVAMPGGGKAMLEPWRNTFAQLASHGDWQDLMDRYASVDIIRYLNGKPLHNLAAMIDKGVNSPLASSCGRLFDAVAAAIGICRDAVSHEGQAAMMLEAAAADVWHEQYAHAYPFQLIHAGDLLVLHWAPLWGSVLADLELGVERNVIAARFHHGLAGAIIEVCGRLVDMHDLETAVLSGGVFQNRLLLEGVAQGLRALPLRVLSPRHLPANDGGLAFGQAVIAAAHDA